MIQLNITSLTEAAAQTHYPPGWITKSIEIKPSGKAPKKYGPSTYRFGASMTLSVILPRRGWTLVKKTKNYVYLIPPAGELKPPFYISIAVPPEDLCLKIAKECYAQGESWLGQLGEWPAQYLHERNTDMVKFSRDPLTGEMVSELLKNPPKSSLHIGEWGAWNADVTGIAGDFAIGIFPPGFIRSEELSPSPLSEGTPREVLLTSFERNEEARRLCIEYYGAKCQACGLVYEDKYGVIGKGLIHVHHVIPLADIGAAYQVDPIKDLIPLCASCHHVAHHRNPPYTVSELRAAIAASL